jgi:hypothetical protein
MRKKAAEDKRRKEEVNKKAIEKKADEEKEKTIPEKAATTSTASTASTAWTVVKDKLEDDSLETTKPGHDLPIQKAKMSFSDESDPDSLPDLSASKEDKAPKAKHGRGRTPDPEAPRPNKAYVRKRKPLTLTMEDLEPEYDDDTECKNNKKKVGGSSRKRPALPIKTREMPQLQRNARQKASIVVEKQSDVDEESV